VRTAHPWRAPEPGTDSSINVTQPVFGVIRSDAGNHVGSLPGALFDLAVMVGRVAIQGQLADLDQRLARMFATIDRLEQVRGVVIGVKLHQLVGLGLGQVLDALIGDEMVFDSGLFAVGVDLHVGVRAVEVHVPPAGGNVTLAHQVGDLVCGGSGVLERVADEEHRSVVADGVVVALGGVELQCPPRGSRQVSGLPRSPATVDNRITVSIVVSG
jgi:hypothetical protein